MKIEMKIEKKIGDENYELTITPENIEVAVYSEHSRLISLLDLSPDELESLKNLLIKAKEVEALL